MNKQHDLHIHLNSFIKISLKPLLFASCMMLALPHSFANDKAMLNELSEEANNTKMANDQSKVKTTEDPTASVKVDSKEVAGDELSEKIELQLRQVLGKTDTEKSSDGDKTVEDRRNTEAELEKIVSSSLLEGARMEDIRSAVGEAMSAIEKEKDSKKAVAPERITEANKAFSKLTITKKPEAETETETKTEKTEKTDDKSDKSTSSETKTTKSEVVVSSGTVKHPETVTVQEGESLFKIALRVYGDGNKYLKLYKANEDRIEDPNILLAGQVLVTPKF